MKNRIDHRGLLATARLSARLSAEDMVFTSWGGTTQDAQKGLGRKLHRRKPGSTSCRTARPTTARSRPWSRPAASTWDVVDVEGDYAVQAGKAGLLETLDFSVIDKTKLDPRFVTDYSVGSFYYSFVIGCNKDAVSACPKTWADLFDTAKFPGKRTFYKWSAPGVIEAALLADGVAPTSSIRSISTAPSRSSTRSRPTSSGGTGGAQSQQLLASAEAPFGSFWNGRLTALSQRPA